MRRHLGRPLHVMRKATSVSIEDGRGKNWALIGLFLLELRLHHLNWNAGLCQESLKPDLLDKAIGVINV